MAIDDGDQPQKRTALAQAQRVVGIIAAVATTMVAVGGFYLALAGRGGQPSIGGPTPTSEPARPPTSVMLSASAPGISPTTQENLTLHSGTTVTLTVIPDHSLVPFQTYTMGIYAQDPYGFSELQYCTYPDTATCSYIVSYSSAEQTDYASGSHTFTAFLGNIGGSILTNSNDITITWS